jgi:hypothetical protein
MAMEFLYGVDGVRLGLFSLFVGVWVGVGDDGLG